MSLSSLSEEEFVKLLLFDKSYCPCLLIGKYVNVFKRAFQGTIERAYTLNDVRRLVEEYDGISHVNSEYLVLDGVGYLSQVGQNSLLKFIEESKLPIVLLSYTDRISPIILSRMKIVMKRWYGVKTLSFSGVKETISALREKKEKDGNFDEVQYLADNCPQLYSLKQQAGDLSEYTNNRMLNILYSSYTKR